MKIFSPVLKGTTVSDGTSNLSGSFSGSFTGTATTASLAITSSYVLASSVDAQQTSRLNTLESVTGSFTLTSSFSAYTASNDSLNTTQNARILSNEQKTGSFATTGSNYFIGTQVVTGSVFISSDLVVQGSSSLQNITASAVSVGTNRIILNTATPILQFGGISVQDSGSTMGRSGSLLWNSINDHWINVNPSGSDEGYNSAMVINGPKNTGSLGSEVGLTTNYIPVSQGEDHITDSIIFQSGSVNIGIGTTNPTQKLDVVGAIKVSDNLYWNSGDATNWYIQGQANGPTLRMKYSGGSTNRDGALGWINNDGVRYDALVWKDTTVYFNGNVGIGNTSPAVTLHTTRVGGTSTYAEIARFESVSLDSGAKITFYGVQGSNSTTKLSGAIGFNQTSNSDSNGQPAFIVETGNNGTIAERMRITSGGNVGIGITNPSAKFQVNGDVILGGSLNSSWAVSVDNLGTTNANGLYVNIGASSTGVPFSVYKNFSALFQIANSGAATFASNVTAGNGTTAVSLAINRGATGDGNGLRFQTAGTNNWYVGSAATATNTNLEIYNHNTAATNLSINYSNGYIGMGTTDPGKRLELSEDNSSTTSTTGLKITNWNGTTNTRAGIVFQNYDNNGAAIWGRRTGSTAGNLIFGTNPGAGTTAESAIVERMRIDNGGNIGIGTTSPLSTLHVNGTVRTVLTSGAGGQTLISAISGVSNGYLIEVDTSNNIVHTWHTGANNTSMRITSGGNVGIGITNPSTKLDINGSVRYRGAIHDEFNYVANGNFTNGTYYNILEVNQVSSGIYILEGYIDTYSAGAGIYFMRFASVPFYFWTAGSNSVTYSDFPAVLGTGHHLGNPFPLFRLQQTLAGGGIFLQFNPNASWSGMDNSSGKTFQVNLKRLGS
jgi:hypothetical protein